MLGKLTAHYPLTRLAWISIAAALATIAIKTLACALTDSPDSSPTPPHP